MLAGDPPYVGILNRAGPLAHLIPALGVAVGRVSPVDEVLSMRALFAALAAGCVALTYVVARDGFGSRLAGIVAAAAVVSFEAFTALASHGPREKVPMVLFMLAALAAVLARRWLLAGLAVSLATLTLQIAFFALLPALVVALAAAPAGTRLRGLGRAVTGGLIPGAIVVLYYALSATVADLMLGFVLLNADSRPANPLLADPATAWAKLVCGFGWSTWAFVGGLLALAGLAGWRLASPARRRHPRTTATAVLATGAVGGLAWTLRDFDHYPDALLLLPFAALGLGAVSAEVAERVRPPAGLAMVAASAVVLAGTGVHYAATHRDDTLRWQRASVAAALEELPGATLWSLEAPQALVLAGRANPTRHQMLASGLPAYIDRTWTGGLSGFFRWNLDREPDLVVIGSTRDRPWVRRPLRADYVRVGEAPGFSWWARRSLGVGRLDSLRDALRRAVVNAPPAPPTCP